MSNYDLRRSIMSDLRLQVIRAKMAILRLHSEALVAKVKAGQADQDIIDAADRLYDVLNELENVAPNLHQ